MTTTLRRRHTSESADSPATAVTQRPWLSLSRLSRWLLVMFVGVFTVRPTADPDLFWHLRTGRWIVENGIPRSDVFSFTVAGNRWVTHEWLTQVLSWGAYSLGGYAAVALLFAAVGAVAMTFTYHTIAGGPIQKSLLTVATMLVATIAFGARPQLFTVAFAAGFVWLVERVRRGESDSRTLWWAVPAGLVWANLHSGFVLGVVILLTYALGDALQRRFVDPDSEVLSYESSARLAKVAVGVFAAAIVNPSGPRLWLYPFETLRSEQMRVLINEWQSPDFHHGVFRPFLLLIVGGIVVMAASRRRPTVTDVLLVGSTMAAALISLRHIALAVVVSMPVLAPHLTSALRESRIGPWLSGDRDRRFSVGPAFTGSVALALAAVVGVFSTQTLRHNDETIAERYPVAAVAWIEDNQLDDVHGYNHYNWGGYLISQDIEVFADGRADVYGDEFLAVIGRLLDADREWEAILAEHDVEWALLPPDQQLVTVMEADEDWEVVYEDDVAVVVERVAPLAGSSP